MSSISRLVTKCDHRGFYGCLVPGQHRKQPLRKEEDCLRSSLAQRRQDRGLSQRGLSDLLGWHPATIGKIERGDRSVSVIELVDIAAVLGIDPLALLGACLTTSTGSAE